MTTSVVGEDRQDARVAVQMMAGELAPGEETHQRHIAQCMPNYLQYGPRRAEVQIVRHALGDVPLVGFFAGGEIARHHLYGYTGVLTVFTDN